MQPPRQLPPQAARVEFLYRDGELYIKRTRQLNKRISFSHLIPALDREAPVIPPAAAPATGFWYEVRVGGQLRYRRVTANPIRRWFEIPSPWRRGEMTRLESLPAETTFALDIPLWDDGSNELLIFTSPVDHVRDSIPAEARWTFTLTPHGLPHLHHDLGADGIP